MFSHNDVTGAERHGSHLPAWLAVGLLIAWLQFDAVRQAFERLGLPPGAALAVLAAGSIGSAVNVPVARLRATGTLLALNIGGCIVPLALAGWVVRTAHLGAVEIAAAVAIVAVASWCASRVEPGVGVTMPGWVAPLAALAASALVEPAALAPLAYVAGTLGTLLGADLLRLPAAARGGAAVLAIGGAGTRDGIFLAGVIAVLFA
jgi:uncharacterized membrane protein